MSVISNVPSRQSSGISRNTIMQLPMRTRQAYTKNTIHTIMTQLYASSGNTFSVSSGNSPSVSNAQPIRSVSKKTRQFGNGVLVNKGQKISLNGAMNITVCAGWNIKDTRCDVDISAFMLDSARKIISDDWFVFYGQTDSPDRSLHLNCDGTQNDDKCIEVNLQKVDASVSRIVFVLTIDEAEMQRLNFSMIDEAYIRILSGNNEVLRFMLTDYYDTVTAMMLGELYRHNGEWKFSAIGDGVKKDLGGLCEMYGVQTE